MEAIKERGMALLEKLLEKLLAQGRQSDLEFRIFPPPAQGHPFLVEISTERYVRQVPVELIAVQRLERGQQQAGLVRDLRTAILAVGRVAARKK